MYLQVAHRMNTLNPVQTERHHFTWAATRRWKNLIIFLVIEYTAPRTTLGESRDKRKRREMQNGRRRRELQWSGRRKGSRKWWDRHCRFRNLKTTARKQDNSLIECCFTFTDTVGLLGTGSPGRPPRLNFTQLLCSVDNSKVGRVA